MFHVLGRLEDSRLASKAPALVSGLVPAEILLTVTDKEQTLVSCSNLAITRCTAERAVTYTQFQFDRVTPLKHAQMSIPGIILTHIYRDPSSAQASYALEPCPSSACPLQISKFYLQTFAL
jgi:hypothetical protein